MELTAEKLQELKDKHGDLFQASRRGNVYIFRYPKRGEWKVFRQSVTDNKSTAIETLVGVCLVYPTLNEMWAIADKDVALVDFIGGQLIQSITEDDQETQGKKI